MASIVGVDIGATGVRGVELTHPSSGATAVKRAAAVPLHQDAVQGGEIKDVGAVASALRELWHQGKFRTKSVALVIGGNPYIVARHAKVMHVPDPSQFATLVRQEAKTAMPVPLDTVYLDFHVEDIRDEPTSENPSRRMAYVMLVGAPCELVDQYIKAVEAAGLRPVSVDTAEFALTRLVSTAEASTGKLNVLVHIGAHSVLLIGMSNGQPLFLRTLNEFAGQTLTEQMQDAFNLHRERAEQVKIEASNSLVLGVDSTATSIVNSSMAALARSCRSTLSEAVKNYNMPLGRVWLSGGGAALGGLAHRLGAELGTAVNIIDPRAWTTKPGKLAAAAQTGQDMTLALAAGGV